MPDPDLIVRTSGEHRISNFLLWQSAYSEFFFTPTLWPDFRPQDLVEAVQEFGRRERRVGGVPDNESTAQLVNRYNPCEGGLSAPYFWLWSASDPGTYRWSRLHSSHDWAWSIVGYREFLGLAACVNPGGTGTYARAGYAVVAALACAAYVDETTASLLPITVLAVVLPPRACFSRGAMYCRRV